MMSVSVTLGAPLVSTEFDYLVSARIEMVMVVIDGSKRE